ncbi:MAG TPA: nucleoside recognition domain-containing protein [Eoetvoesiella sp.]
MELIDIILTAGRSAVDIAFFLLLPIMVVMLFLMRMLEAWGVLDWIVVRLAPILKPAGLTGLSVFAALQVNFVSFAAPIATLSIMQHRGSSDRHLAATLAMILAMAQGNVMFPFAAIGLHLGPTLLFSLVGGVIAAASTYYLFGRSLSTREASIDETIAHPTAEGAKGVLDVINRAGAEAFKIAVGTIPMLVLSLMVITYLRSIGVLDWVTLQITPVLAQLGIDPVIVLPTLTKIMGGGTAMMGLVTDMHRSGLIDAKVLNESAGWLIHTFDIPGVAIILSAGRRVAAVWKPAALGACVGIALRALVHVAI